MSAMRSLVLLAALGALSGCASQGLYHWGHYEDLVYDMYTSPGKAEPGAQMAVLVEDIDTAHAKGQRVPPGVHAHLGFLLYQLGNEGSAEKEFQTEKALYPESTVFVDGLLQRMKQRGATP